MAVLDSYAILFIVPVICVPVQFLYLKAGQRYDLGVGTYVSAGAFFAACWSLSATHHIALELTAVLFYTLLVAFAIRVFAMAYGRPSDFTLISFGQLWATPALIDYELHKLTNSSGLQLESVHIRPAHVAIGGACVAAGMGYIISRSSLPDRLVALTEAPVQYRLVLGSPMRLALKLEVLALIVYFSAGVIFSLTLNDLSADTFGTETIWCVLAAAPLGRSMLERSRGFWVILGPIAATLLRYLVKSFVPATLATMVGYVTLAIVLVFVATLAKEASRDAFVEDQ